MTNEITQQAIDQVRHNNKADYDAILNFAENFVKKQFKEFTNEDIKRNYYLAGNPIPKQVNVYGAVIRDLSKRKLIFKNSVGNATTEQSHSRLIQRWISKEYRLKQQSNRTTETTLKLEL